VKKQPVTKCYTGSQNWMDSLEQSRQCKMDITFGIWNVRTLYRADSMKTVASELAKYNLDLGAV